MGEVVHLHVWVSKLVHAAAPPASAVAAHRRSAGALHRILAPPVACHECLVQGALVHLGLAAQHAQLLVAKPPLHQLELAVCGVTGLERPSAVGGGTRTRGSCRCRDAVSGCRSRDAERRTQEQRC